LGVKGAGEGGIIGTCAVIASAVEDALAPLGVQITEMPLTPYRLWRIIQDGHGSSRHHFFLPIV
jgi:carbon-monoxide dehydrogenase large subunit